jgi:hypothetical protein
MKIYSLIDIITLKMFLNSLRSFRRILLFCFKKSFVLTDHTFFWDKTVFLLQKMNISFCFCFWFRSSSQFIYILYYTEVSASCVLMISLLRSQVKAHGPDPTENLRTSIDLGSSIPDRNVFGFFRCFSTQHAASDSYQFSELSCQE